MLLFGAEVIPSWVLQLCISLHNLNSDDEGLLIAVLVGIEGAKQVAMVVVSAFFVL